MQAASSNFKAPPKPLRSTGAISTHCSSWPRAASNACSPCSERCSPPNRRMPVEPRVAALAERVGSFHITERGMKRAQQEVERAIQAGDVDEPTRAAYFAAVRRYFESFGREARTHLRNVDRRLVHVNQVQFNLTAERGVAVKRIEA